ncbi:hypothetical protein BU17DRAFT_41493 [Hysterangium stoloniferum]|nr:hypothetical protein BU17DRAFT_41493 [Hysterangium stoloniferum]
MWFVRRQRQISIVPARNSEGKYVAVRGTHSILVKSKKWPALADFKYPEFEPWHGFDILNTKPAPYRPFRWEGYPINMGIRPMPWASWIELDNKYLEYLEIRKARVASRGDKVVRTLPGAEQAALEACTELSAYLAKRYPNVFRVEHAGRVKIIEILPTGDRWDLDVDDPMTVAGLLADDLAIMIEGPDGLYYMQAGSICVPGIWRIVDKIGLPLAEIHLRGRVYKYKEKLEFSMDRFFKKLAVDKPIQRNNYSFQLGPDLAWLSSHGNEDDFDQETKKPRQGTDSAISDIYFRSERQTLRKLPLTGCILFTIRTYFHPVTEIITEPGVPGRIAAAIRGWDEAVALRKDKELYADIMLPWLDDLHEKQVAAEIIRADDRANRYPY